MRLDLHDFLCTKTLCLYTVGARIPFRLALHPFLLREGLLLKFDKKKARLGFFLISLAKYILLCYNIMNDYCQKEG